MWALLRFQSSIRNSAHEVQFTINLAVIGKAKWARAQRWWRERWPEAKALEPVPLAGAMYPGEASFAWDRRIGHLTPENHDFWWIIDSEDSVAIVAESAVNAVRSYGLPALLRERDRVAAGLS